ncbi:hypothetical protein AB0I28_06755 [Phytomonospora sp. NPDC050363]|uniref:hypothetical protein n=1 Tax=Phytomonospora sp. NPDC050363 TaxID=3155642 RepID=UPI0033E631DF
MPTTPQHLAGIEDRFPELAAYRRTATRLHPRRGNPRVDDSSVGSPLLWPAEEPWPVCEGPHEPFGDVRNRADVATQRRLRELADRRPLTPAELDDQAKAWAPADAEFGNDTPLPLLPVAQLRRSNVFDFIGPDDADLAQVLWCPMDHPSDDYCPTVTVRWRRAAEVGERLPASEQGPDLVSEPYVPAPCVVLPEQVTEYEYGHLLPGDLRRRIQAWEAGTVQYGWGRSITKGWKVGGFASWTLSDPMDMICECGSDLRLFLKVEGGEWDGDRLWVPDDSDTFDGDPTGITIGRGYALWIWVCPADYSHPVRTSMQ